jgi:hypothetical protein
MTAPGAAGPLTTAYSTPGCSVFQAIAGPEGADGGGAARADAKPATANAANADAVNAVNANAGEARRAWGPDRTKLGDNPAILAAPRHTAAAAQRGQLTRPPPAADQIVTIAPPGMLSL